MKDWKAPSVRALVLLEEAVNDASLELGDYRVLVVHDCLGVPCSLRDLLLEALGDAERDDVIYLLVSYLVAGPYEVVPDESLHGIAGVAWNPVSLGVGTLAGDVEALAEVQNQPLRVFGELVLAHLAYLPLQPGYWTG